LLIRQEGTAVTFYVGDLATVTATLPPGCQWGGCTVDASTIRVDGHVTLSATRIASVQSTSSAVGRTLYYYRDRQGSVIATSFGGGGLGVRLRYSPYGLLEKVDGAAAGDPQCRASPGCPELGYTGALRLSGARVYLQTRVYDPEIRQFITADSVDAVRYGYVRGDPANHVDPDGRMSRADASLGGAGSGWGAPSDDKDYLFEDIADIREQVERSGDASARRKMHVLYMIEMPYYAQEENGLIHGPYGELGVFVKDMWFEDGSPRADAKGLRSARDLGDLYRVVNSDPIQSVAHATVKMWVTRAVAAEIHELTPLVAAAYVGREVLSPTVGSELMAGMAVKSALRTLVVRAPLTVVAWGIVQLELDAYTAGVASTQDAIYRVLENSRALR
jgi:RHS repeat-associated protein